MGVHGLSTFVDDNKDLFLTDHKLHDTKVIIDGSNLFHFLYYHYKISHQFGGDYDHFARKCKRFFNILKDCNVTPYVIFDGGYDPDDRKLPVVLERMNDRRKKVSLICAKGRGCVLPILSYETFHQVLVELGIPHASCVYEADREIAVLAKKWKCPVLSNDSDFFIYRLEGGFIPLDYINLTLCLYDTCTEVASVLERNCSAGENEFVYIPVKHYSCERFLKLFKKDDDDFVLPLFATVLGNDYVDYSVLYSFYQALRAPKNPSKKSVRVKASGRFEAVIHWVDNIDNETEALGLILETTTKERRDSVREILVRSITEYKDLEHFTSFDLEKILVGKSSSDTGKPTESNFPELTDYFDRKFPLWFAKQLRMCEVTGSFLQNAGVNHRVIFNCQVEMLRETSSYACSRKLRRLIYGILISPLKCDGSGKQTKDNNVVEYDRQGKDTKKFYVEPVATLPGLSGVPNLEKIHSMSMEERKKVLYAAFDGASKSVDGTMNKGSQLFILILSFWIKNAHPKVRESHLSALIICVIALHIKQMEWLDTKKSQGFSPCQPKMYPDIVEACVAMEEKRIEFFKRQTDKHFSRPEHSAKIPRDNKVVHGFAQFQACYLDTLYLNQVLSSPICIPSPSMILNCTYVYNLCRDLESRAHSELYCADILGRGSALHNLFLSWKQVVISLCKEDSFEADRRKGSAAGGKKSVKSKSKAKKPKVNSQQHREKGSSSEGEGGLTVTLNCAVSNKFSLLDMNDS